MCTEITNANHTTTFISARRLNASLIASAEKSILVKLAQHTPEWINSDHLTILGFVAQCSVGICYGIARWHPFALLFGILFIGLNWLGDSLDGTLARFRNRQRPRYGFYVDHVSDSIAAVFLMGGLAVSGYASPIIALGMLIAFLLLSIESYLATYTLGDFQLAYWRFGPTEIRILLAIGNIALLRFPGLLNVALLHLRLRLFDIGGSIAICGMIAMTMHSAILHIARLYREEKLS